MGFENWLHGRRQMLKFYKDVYSNCYRNKYLRSNRLPFDEEGSIPKIIHYCWFGKGELPDLLKKCINTWREVLPDYELKLWDEDTFPIEMFRFSKQAYEQKKYVFVSDVARWYAVYNYGGIYLDTDVEILKPFDDLLRYNAFIGYESPNLISTATFGAKKHHPWIYDMFTWYEDVDFCADYNEIASTRIMSKKNRVQYGIRMHGRTQDLPIGGGKLFERSLLCPEQADGKWNITNDTYAVHHFTGLW